MNSLPIYIYLPNSQRLTCLPGIPEIASEGGRMFKNKLKQFLLHKSYYSVAKSFADPEVAGL